MTSCFIFLDFGKPWLLIDDFIIFFKRFKPLLRYLLSSLYANPVKIIAAHPIILFSTSDKFLISFKRWFVCFWILWLNFFLKFSSQSS
jgi:hypothetical protein